MTRRVALRFALAFGLLVAGGGPALGQSLVRVPAPPGWTPRASGCTTVTDLVAEVYVRCGDLACWSTVVPPDPH